MDFGILLGLAYQHFVVDLNRHLADQGFRDIGPSYGYVFRALADERKTTAQLAAQLGITSQGMAKIVEDMESTGYLRRHPDPKDARVKLLDLTPHGRAALAAARRFHHDFEVRLGHKVGKGRVATVREVLTEILGASPAEGLTRTLRPL
jgi:DNA-binding MarR family transcriptional regulator